MDIRSATVLEEEPGWAISPDGVKFKINTCTPFMFWHFGGQIPKLELIKPEEIAKRYFYTPFFFFNPKTGNLTFFESSLAQVAHLIVKDWVRSRDWARVIGFEDVA